MKTNLEQKDTARGIVATMRGRGINPIVRLSGYPPAMNFTRWNPLCPRKKGKDRTLARPVSRPVSPTCTRTRTPITIQKQTSGTMLQRKNAILPINLEPEDAVVCAHLIAEKRTLWTTTGNTKLLFTTKNFRAQSVQRGLHHSIT